MYLLKRSSTNMPARATTPIHSPHRPHHTTPHHSTSHHATPTHLRTHHTPSKHITTHYTIQIHTSTDIPPPDVHTLLNEKCTHSITVKVIIDTATSSVVNAPSDMKDPTLDQSITERVSAPATRVQEQKRKDESEQTEEVKNAEKEEEDKCTQSSRAILAGKRRLANAKRGGRNGRVRKGSGSARTRSERSSSVNPIFSTISMESGLFSETNSVAVNVLFKNWWPRRMNYGSAQIKHPAMRVRWRS